MKWNIEITEELIDNLTNRKNTDVKLVDYTKILLVMWINNICFNIY